MKAKKIWLIVGIIILVGISIFTSLHYYALLDQNRILQRLVRGYEKKLNDSEAAKKAMETQLTLEKESFNLQLKEAQQQLKQVSEELNSAKGKVVSLQNANMDLLETQKQLQDKVEQIAQDKTALEAKFNSLDELKKAIRDIKIKRRQQKLAEKRAKEERQLIEGNKGYILFQGESTMRGKVKIEVIPVP